MVVNSRQSQDTDGAVFWNASQLVAYNLRRARHKTAMTQQQAADAVSRYTDRPWTQAIFATAESSIAGVRIRQFSPSELVAFCFVFDVPIGWFFTPPSQSDAVALSMPNHVDGIGWSWIAGRTTPTESNISAYLQHQRDVNTSVEDTTDRRPAHGVFSRVLRLGVDADDDELQTALLIGRLRRSLLGNIDVQNPSSPGDGSRYGDASAIMRRIADAFAAIARGHGGS
jgi:hypothetical protein